MLFVPKNLTPSLAKKAVYLTATTVMGLLLSLIAHALIENAYLNWAVANGKAITWYAVFSAGQCALHPAIQIGLLLTGALGGFFIGRLWWQAVYVDKIWLKQN